MYTPIPIIAGVMLISGACGIALAVEPFETATVRFEHNVTDSDVEVVFEARGGDEGLSQLTITAPDGRVVLDARAPDASTMGIRQFVLESPEPDDVAALKSAYPEGEYTFTGAGSGGRKFHGESRLSYAAPAPVEILLPQQGVEIVSTTNMLLSWRPVEGAAAYSLEVEQEDAVAQLKATLPGTVTRFEVPQGFLRAGGVYKVAIGAVGESGNFSVVETEFKTAGSSGRNCANREPVDAFSAQLDSLLASVEGTGFPDASSLATWPERRAEIRTHLGQILKLTAGDEARRRAAVETILTAETLVADSETSRRFVDLSRGEVRAWARRVMREYAPIGGATKADRKLLSAALITQLKDASRNAAVKHPQKTLPLYQERVAALKALSNAQQSVACR